MNYSGADMQIAEWKDRQQNTADQLARALARIRELEAALRDISVATTFGDATLQTYTWIKNRADTTLAPKRGDV